MQAFFFFKKKKCCKNFVVVENSPKHRDPPENRIVLVNPLVLLLQGITRALTRQSLK